MPYKQFGILLVSALFAAIPFSAVTTAQEKAINNNISFQRDLSTTSLRMLRAKSGGISLQTKNNETTADLVKQQFAPYFGIIDPTNELTVTKEFYPSANRHNIRYQQQHKGIPVIGGELIANLDSQQLTSMSGEMSQVNLANHVPTISAEQAQATAIAAVSKWYKLNPVNLTASEPTLSIYDPSLIGPGTGQQHLVWELSVTPTELAPINEYVLVDAARNVIVLHFNNVHAVLNRETYTANGLEVLPGTLVCDESDPACSAGDTDAQNAHLYAADTYNFYFTNHGRDSLDGNGMTIRSTTHYGSFPNAFWTSNQIVYSDGFSSADDVVSHELTHGVTDYSSNLFLYYQSGAISESFSDIWGEFVDLTNTSGNDTAGVRWHIGEDLPGGAIRNMADPTLFGDPDRMTSPNYEFTTNFGDNGGIHTNSGINNKAVYLMVDGSAAEPGGQFNGQTISGIGITKTAAIYYDVQTNYLVSGSDYIDLYNTLNQSCQNLVGTNGITASDCTQVNKALLAVEMDQEPSAGFSPEATICSGTDYANDIFFDDMEASSGNWETTTLVGTNPWVNTTGYAKSGQQSFAAFPAGSAEDSSLAMINSVALPMVSDIYLHFDHAFDYETDTSSNNYDGGIIEYSINGGASWIDAGPLIDSGRSYGGVLFSGNGNPQAGRNAFVAASHGYNSSRVNLASLAGNDIQIRFRHTADDAVASLFWHIDNVRIYACGATAQPVANAGPDQTVTINASVTLDGSASADADSSFTYQWTQTTGATVTLSGATTANPTFTAPATSDQLDFQLTTSDPDGNTTTDTVTVNVTEPPTANAGPDQTVNTNASVTLDGSASTDADSSFTYQWTQTAGTTVTLSGATTANPTFTAPATSVQLSFQLTTSDPDGNTDADTVTVKVTVPPTANAGPDQTVNTNASVTLDGSASADADSSFTYQWTQTAGTTVTLTGATTANPTFTAPAIGVQLSFQLTTSDPDGNTDADTVTINVNDPPTANAGGNQTVGLSASVTLNGSSSIDPEGSALTYSWVQTAGATVTLSNTAIASPTFTAPASSDTLSFQLTVTDNRSQSDVDIATITVQATGGSGGGSGGGGGGCTVSENGRFDPLWLLLLLFFAGLHLRNTNKRNKHQRKV